MVVHKEKTIELIDIYEPDLIVPVGEFHFSHKGNDMNGNNIIELAVFDNISEAQDWCDRENDFNKKYNSEYYDCGYDSRTGELWGE